MCSYEYIPTGSFSLVNDTECLTKNQCYLGIAAFLLKRKLIERFGNCINMIYYRSCGGFSTQIPSRNMYTSYFISVEEKKNPFFLENPLSHIGIFSILIKPRDLF